MAAITAGMVKDLREKTDAPMMECKKALSEADGDMGKAEELLRVKLGNKATKAASRITAEGIVSIEVSGDGKRAAMVELNCETDFVSKNDDFLGLGADVARLVVAQSPADVEALSAAKLGDTDDVAKMEVRRWARGEVLDIMTLVRDSLGHPRRS